MRKVAWWMLGCVLIVNICACNGKNSDQPAQRGKAEQKVNPTEAGSNKDLALKFLAGIQSGDKSKMYEAANLTTDVVNASREKLIHAKQNNLTDKERLECEHALRTSGNIDFFTAKMRKMFPKSSVIQVTQTTTKEVTADTNHLVHGVTITYNDKAEAMLDKTGKPVKTMAIHLQQIDRPLDGRPIHEFSFDNKDFEKIAGKDFEVLSYF